MRSAIYTGVMPSSVPELTVSYSMGNWRHLQHYEHNLHLQLRNDGNDPQGGAPTLPAEYALWICLSAYNITINSTLQLQNFTTSLYNRHDRRRRSCSRHNRYTSLHERRQLNNLHDMVSVVEALEGELRDIFTGNGSALIMNQFSSPLHSSRHCIIAPRT